MKKNLLLTTLIATVILFASISTLFAQGNSQGKDVYINFAKPVKAIEKKNILRDKEGIRMASEEHSGLLISKKIKIPIKNYKPFLSFATVIEAENLTEENFSIFVRASKDGKKWEEWDKLTGDEHSNQGNEENNTLNRFVCYKQFQNAQLKFIQYKIEFSNSKIKIKKLRLNFFSPGDVEEKIGGDNYLPESLSCPCPLPSYTNRVGWGCPQGENFPVNPTTTVTHLLVSGEIHTSCLVFSLLRA